MSSTGTRKGPQPQQKDTPKTEEQSPPPAHTAPVEEPPTGGMGDEGSTVADVATIIDRLRWATGTFVWPIWVTMPSGAEHMIPLDSTGIIALVDRRSRTVETGAPHLKVYDILTATVVEIPAAACLRFDTTDMEIIRSGPSGVMVLDKILASAGLINRNMVPSVRRATTWAAADTDLRVLAAQHNVDLPQLREWNYIRGSVTTLSSGRHLFVEAPK